MSKIFSFADKAVFKSLRLFNSTESWWDNFFFKPFNPKKNQYGISYDSLQLAFGNCDVGYVNWPMWGHDLCRSVKNWCQIILRIPDSYDAKTLKKNQPPWDIFLFHLINKVFKHSWLGNDSHFQNDSFFCKGGLFWLSFGARLEFGDIIERRAVFFSARTALF